MGKPEGVIVGNIFDVVRVETTRDPDTNVVMDENVQVIGKIKITEVRDRISIGTVTSGRGIKARDLVRLQGKAKP